MTTPKMIIRSFGEKTVLSCAVTSDGETAVIGGPDGVGRTIHLGIPDKRKKTTSEEEEEKKETEEPEEEVGKAEWGPNLRKEPHYGDINALRMFPSDKVVLSCGSDLVLGVWDLASGRRAATLRGHKRGVLSAAIIDRGRNVVSASSDGTVKLWEIASQTVIRDLFVSPEDPTTMKPAVNCVCVVNGYTHTESAAERDPREVGTDNKLVLAALESGGFCGLDPRAAATTVFEAKGPGAAGTACCVSGGLYVCGYESGDVWAFDGRMAAEPVKRFGGFSGAAVSGLCATDEGGKFWVAKKDGYLWLQNGCDGEKEVVVNTHRFEPITCIDTYDRGRGVVAGLKDGGVLVYDFPSV